MKSIRAQLLFWLIPSFIIIAILAVSSLYFSEKKRLITNLDNELTKLIRAVKLTYRMPGNRFASPLERINNLTEKTNVMLANDSSDFYLQLRNEAGDLLGQSTNLGDEQLSDVGEKNRSNEQLSEMPSYDSRLTSGEAIRVNSFTIQATPRGGAIHAVIAISKKENNQRLASFAVKVITGAVICCLLLVGILIFAIKKILVPIQKLSEQVTNVEAGTLHNRFNEKNVPTEITPLADRLNKLLARLEQSFARERQFNNDIAHELRTPLAAIRTTSEVALKWPEQASIDDHQYIAESSAQLQNTIDSLLSLARIESSGSELHVENVNLVTIVEECIALQLHTMKERNITITLLIDEDYSIQSDPHLLRIVISNLINNAVEYAPEDSEIIISGKQHGAVLSVANMAPNLTETDITTMFDRLWRKDNSRTDSKHIGLGLSIADSAAQALMLDLTATLVHPQMLRMSLISR